MKIFFVLCWCLIFAANVLAQTDGDAAESPVKRLWLARDNGNGDAGEATDVFSTTDKPIHCLVRLAASGVVTVKLNLVAVKAGNLKPESSVVVLEYRTTEAQNGVQFDYSPDKLWTPGTYRADVSVAGKLAASLNFTVEKAASEAKTADPKLAPARKPAGRKKSRN